MSTKPLRRVPTNIITGFLGVGKTTSINHLLAKKPVSERWAVLVNEFGQIGLDKTLLEAESVSPGLLIKEVPGGCMCCSAGLPVTVALNQILREVKPDRLLIEPSGLGHPKEILEILSGQQYENWIDLGATITMVDARHFSQARYTSHEIFIQQIEVADLIVVNKADQQIKADIGDMQRFLHQHQAMNTPVQTIVWGQLSATWLDMPSLFNRSIWQKVSASEIAQTPMQQYIGSGMSVYQHDGGGWYSLGIRFDNSYQFNTSALLAMCQSLNVERLKAVMNTETGALMINQVNTDIGFTETADFLPESRIELISNVTISISVIKKALSNCLMHTHQ